MESINILEMHVVGGSELMPVHQYNLTIRDCKIVPGSRTQGGTCLYLILNMNTQSYFNLHATKPK